VETVDERLSSAQAGRELRENGINGRRQQRPMIDQAAAAIILQAWLDSRSQAPR
jgi:putative Holliday junction resolvase